MDSKVLLHETEFSFLILIIFLMVNEYMRIFKHSYTHTYLPYDCNAPYIV